MRFMPAAVGFCLFTSPLLAKADKVIHFDINDADNLTGTVSIDVTRGYIRNSSLLLDLNGTPVTLTGGGGESDGLTGFDLLYFTDTDDYQLLLSSPNSDGTLKGFTGGEFFFSDADGEISTSGELVEALPVASQPEPPSLLLLATGLVVAGALVARCRHEPPLSNGI